MTHHALGTFGPGDSDCLYPQGKQPAHNTVIVEKQTHLWHFFVYLRPIWATFLMHTYAD